MSKPRTISPQRSAPTDLRRLARQKPCMVRGANCNGDPETTVLAHLRRGHVAGFGQKPPDVIGVFACSACHDAIDSRQGSITDAEILEALCRQLAWYVREGVLTW